MKKFLLYILPFFFVTSLFANETDVMKKANSLYSSRSYEQASVLYNQLLKSDKRAALHYNLGNAYYKQNKIGLAILNYEKASKLDPSDEDVKHNISVARSQIQDPYNLTDLSNSNFWFSSILNFFSSFGWSVFFIVFEWIFFISLFLSVIVSNLLIKKISILSSISSLVFFVVFFCFSFCQHKNESSTDYAIITDKEASIKSSPDNISKNILLLQEGIKVHILDKYSGYYEILINNDRKGWIPVSCVTVI